MSGVWGYPGCPPRSPLTPAKAGVQGEILGGCGPWPWIPASAGMSGVWGLTDKHNGAHPAPPPPRAPAPRPEAAPAEPMRVSAFGVSGPKQATLAEPADDRRPAGGRPPGAGARKRTRREGHKPPKHQHPRAVSGRGFPKSGIGGAPEDGHPILCKCGRPRAPHPGVCTDAATLLPRAERSRTFRPSTGQRTARSRTAPLLGRLARAASSRSCASFPAFRPGGHHSPSAHRACPFVTRARARPSGPQPTWRSVRHGSQRVERQREDTGGLEGRG